MKMIITILYLELETYMQLRETVPSANMSIIIILIIIIIIICNYKVIAVDLK
jgi:hypothetical protein